MGSGTMTSYLLLSTYEESSDLNRSDQITVPAEVWAAFDRDHVGDGPIFVDVGSVVCRLRPAVPSDGLRGDSCRVPLWVVRRLAPVETETDTWVGLTACQLALAHKLVLRARREADMTESPDPIAMLTAALSGSTGGPSWACLSVGSELPLSCGTFDVMEIWSAPSVPAPAACFLNCDVNLEFAVALDHVEPESEPLRSGGFVPFSGKGNRLGRG